jgi:hypothetical protein
MDNLDTLDPNEPLIFEDVPPANLRSLASAIVIQAIRDITTNKNTLSKKMKALAWLASPDFEVWADWAGMPYLNPYKLLGNLRAVEKQLRYRSTHGER